VPIIKSAGVLHFVSELKSGTEEVRTVKPDVTVAEAIRRMRDELVGALVVSEDGTSILGIVSDRGIVDALADHGVDVLKDRVRSVMTEGVLTGFAASEDANLAVCVLPGTELSFATEVTCLPIGLLAWREKVIKHKTAIFRQINKERVAAHHDALEFPDGQILLLTFLCEGQQGTVLQLPVQPGNAVEADAQKRAAYSG
jgi:CBS domain-containing protein